MKKNITSVLMILTIVVFVVVFVAIASGKNNESNTLAANLAKIKYHALIIGNNDYKYLPQLKTAINDVKEIEKVLKIRYGFETKLLTDATRDQIMDALNELRKSLGENDNLLIYYAGHGEFDKEADKAYWIPVDAQRNSTTRWIIVDDITSMLKVMNAKHVLIVSDSCYSGKLARAVSTDISAKGGREEYLRKLMERPSRTLMASGGNEPVADANGIDNHSVFASAFLQALNEPDKNVFTAEELFIGSVKQIVAGKSEQVPEYNNIKNSGGEGGDFVFKTEIIVAAKGGDAGFGPLTPPHNGITLIQYPTGLSFPSFNNYTDMGLPYGSGSEQMFFAAENVTKKCEDATAVSDYYSDATLVTVGDKIRFVGYLHNNGHYNDPAVTAHGVNIKVDGFTNQNGSWVSSDFTTFNFTETISSKNTTPASIWDTTNITSTNGNTIHLKYVNGSMYQRSATGGPAVYVPDPSGFFNGSGTPIGDPAEPLSGNFTGSKIYFYFEATVEAASNVKHSQRQ